MTNDSAIPVVPSTAPSNGEGNGNAQNGNGSVSFTVKTGLAQMLKGGVIMDVVNAEQVGQNNSPLFETK